MSGHPRALVVGGSVGGLFAAHMLRSIGWDVVVFERSGDDLARRGAGIGASEAMFAVLRRIGVPFDASNGIAFKSRLWLEPSGNIAAELPFSGGRRHCLGPSLSGAEGCDTWGMLLLQQNTCACRTTFGSGDGDLCGWVERIGFSADCCRWDPLDSAPTAFARGRAPLRWLCLLAGCRGRGRHPAQCSVALIRSGDFLLSRRRTFLGMPNPGINQNILPGRRRYYFVWYRPVDYESTLQDLCTDATGRRHGVAIPPPLIRHEFIRELKATAAAVLAPEMATIVARTEQPLLQAVFDLESPQLVFGRVVILGDAAFVARPHVVAGVTKAALDAQCLADALVAAGNDVEPALAHYDTERRRFGHSLVARARHLGAYLEAHQAQNEEERRQTHLTRDPELFMRDYGADELVGNDVRESPIAHRELS